MSLVNPLKLAIFRVKSALLKGSQFQSESGADFPQTDFLAIFAETVKMMTEEDVIALIVECDDAPTCLMKGRRGVRIKRKRNSK